jgi:NDP-sugar pyrophosphorylase family protein
LINCAIILVGGFGTRLKTISDGKPKALMPVGDSVYLDLLMEKVFRYKIKCVFLSINYQSDLFQDYIFNSFYKDRLIPIIEPSPLGTGGAVKYVIENSSIPSKFIVMNGDSISDIDLARMIAKFDVCDYTAMIGVSEVEDAGRYGAVLLNNDNVESFQEKGISGSGWINNGYYIFRKESFENFNGVFSLEKNIFPKLIQDKKLGAFRVVNDNFIDMGIPEDYRKLCKRYEVTHYDV